MKALGVVDVFNDSGAYSYCVGKVLVGRTIDFRGLGPSCWRAQLVSVTYCPVVRSGVLPWSSIVSCEIGG